MWHISRQLSSAVAAKDSHYLGLFGQADLVEYVVMRPSPSMVQGETSAFRSVMPEAVGPQHHSSEPYLPYDRSLFAAWLCCVYIVVTALTVFPYLCYDRPYRSRDL